MGYLVSFEECHFIYILKKIMGLNKLNRRQKNLQKMNVIFIIIGNNFQVKQTYLMPYIFFLFYKDHSFKEKKSDICQLRIATRTV